MGSAIDAGAIPTCTYDLDGLDTAASGIATDGTTISTAGTDINASWQGLSPVYKAPESATLLAAMAPVKAAGDLLGADLGSVGSILRGFVSEMRPIKAKLDSLRTDAQSFRDGIAGDDEWDHDQDNVDRNNQLVHDVNGAVVAMMTAERNCANAIDALFGGTQYHAATSENDPNGYGVDSLPDDAKTPWGSKVSREDSCPKSALVGTGHFFKGIGTGFMGMVTGLYGLVNFTDWDKFTQSWKGMGELLLTLPLLPGLPIGTFVWGPEEEARRLAALGKGFLGGDHWDDDPAQAAGEGFFNVASLFVPGGGEASAVGHGAEAAGIAGKAAEAAGEAGRLARAGDFAAGLGKTALRAFLDPTTIIPFDKLPKLGDIANRLTGAGKFDGDGALAHLDQTIDGLPIGKGLDNNPVTGTHVGGMDHHDPGPSWGQAGADTPGLPRAEAQSAGSAMHGGGHDAPALPARDREPVTVGGGHDGPGAGSGHSGGGGGHDGPGAGSGHSGGGGGHDGPGAGSGHSGGHDGPGAGGGHDGPADRKPWNPDPAHDDIGTDGPVGADGAHPQVGSAPTPLAQALDRLRLTTQQKGDLGEALTRDMINRDPDLRILGEQVKITVDGRTAKADFLVRDPEGNIYAVESKFGPKSQFTDPQVDVYRRLDEGPARVQFEGGQAPDVAAANGGRLPTTVDGVQVMRWNRGEGSLAPTIDEVSRAAQQLRAIPDEKLTATLRGLTAALDSPKFDALLARYGAGTMVR